MTFNIVFMGTPAFAVPTLDALHARGHYIQAAYTQPPRPAGRGNQLRKSPVQIRAEQLGIPTRSPLTLRTDEQVAEINALAPDWIIVAAYGMILPKAILAIPQYGCLNVHGSLLPRWRGAAPVQRAIIAGDDRTGISIMNMEAGLDTGPIRLIDSFLLLDLNTSQAMDKLADLGAGLMLTVLEDPGAYPAVPQPENGITYAAKIEKSECRIDPNLSAAQITRMVRAFAPAPGAWISYKGERIKVLCCDAVEGSGKPGTFVDERMSLACGDGILRIHRAQRPGKSPLHPEDLVLGFPIKAGTAID